MITELVVILAALCFACIRTDYVRRGGFLALAIAFWGLARFLTELNYGRAQYDTSYTYGTVLSYGAGFCMVASLLALSGACWRAERKTARARTTESQTAPQPEEPPADPSDRLRELLDKDE